MKQKIHYAVGLKIVFQNNNKNNFFLMTFFPNEKQN